MNFTETLITAFRSVSRNRLRSVLTMLGVIIGIFSITSVMTLLNVMQSTVERNLNTMGTNTFYISLYSAMDFSGDDESYSESRKKLTYADYLALKKRVGAVDFFTAEVSGNREKLSFGRKTTKSAAQIIGATPEWIYSSGYELEYGRMFSEGDVKNYRGVAIVGRDVVSALMPSIDPEGKTIFLNGHRLTVVGVLAGKGAVFGDSMDNVVVLPLSFHNKIFGNPEYGLDLAGVVQDGAKYSDAVEETTAVLRQIRKVPFGRKNDFEITSNNSLLEKFNSLTGTIRLAAVIAGSVALLAAGIGIMNIMLVSVTERTGEIGIRKSLGATKTSILLQFLAEAVILTQTGGIIGGASGVAAAEAAAVYMNMAVVLPWGWMVAGMAVCTVIGTLFGVYPAMKAAMLNPVEAFQYK